MADPSLPTHPSPASGAASSTSTSTTTPQTTKSMAATTDNKKAPTNPRGIPYAPFIEKVEDYIPQTSDRASQRQYVEATLKKFDEMIQKYQFMEANTSKRAEGLRDKIPEYKRTLETVRFLISRQEQKGDGDGDGLSEGGENGDDDDGAIETAFELNDTLYAKARVPVTDEVYIWLGANVMLSYPLAEAEQLLTGKLEAAKTGLANCELDADFLREQITTLEVALARVYNWDVSQRRLEGTGK